MNGQTKSGRGRRGSLAKVEPTKDREVEKKDFCLFYICELLNVIYSTYRNSKPMYVHFVCSEERGSESEGESECGSDNKSGSKRESTRKRGSTRKRESTGKRERTSKDEITGKDKRRSEHERSCVAQRKRFHYTPNSVLEQYFPEHFKNVHFLCAHYAMWENQPNNDENKGDSPGRTNLNDISKKRKRRGLTDSAAEQSNSTYRKEETFYFIFTFYMQPNFLWEEINIPIFHDKGYIECKFDCISNLVKLNDVVHLTNRVKLQTHNQTLIQCIQGGVASGGVSNEGAPNGGNPNTSLLNGGNPNTSLPNGGYPNTILLSGVNSTNQRRGDVHLLPFFISSHCMRRNDPVCLTRVITCNDRGVYCKRDEGKDLPIQLLLLVRKKLHKTLKSMERDAALVCHLRRNETKGGDYTKGDYAKEDYAKGDYAKGDSPKFVLAKEDPPKNRSDMTATIRSDEHSDGTGRASGRSSARTSSRTIGPTTGRTTGSRIGDIHTDRPNSKNARDNLAGVDYDEIHKLINCTETIFKKRIPDQQLEKLLLRMRTRGNAHSEVTRGSLSNLGSAANSANLGNIANFSNIGNVADIANLASIAQLTTPGGGLPPNRTNFPKKEAMDVHLGIEDYYEFVRSGKNELKNTLLDPSQLGIDVNKTSKKNKFV
ncbi:hypothetical protein C922_00806 [Plasmodium inui San Antonio 1]|uniref:Uncharacterized protein n=1 Tax=Plasmodium inui San Antonio 1 TaxID=1237626 RepID=W7AJU9_9APIC|nr:hypothetical protein C922_00806 [Plasmodium inui San Antonio 1]EUD69114.1 hypothetical protein C922_00806 [Plasmodium inui San Antonio 1]